MALTSAQVDAKVEQVVTYLEAGNFAAARALWRSVEVMLAAMPNFGRAGSSVQYDRERLKEIGEMLAQAEREAAARGGFQTLADFRTEADGDE